MIINVFCHHVKDVDFLDNFMFTKDSKEGFITGARRAVKLTKDSQILQKLVGRELCFLGTIDDLTGEIKAQKEIVLDFDNFIVSEVEQDDRTTN